jgi:hypothetical protein
MPKPNPPLLSSVRASTCGPPSKVSPPAHGWPVWLSWSVPVAGGCLKGGGDRCTAVEESIARSRVACQRLRVRLIVARDAHHAGQTPQSAWLWCSEPQRQRKKQRRPPITAGTTPRPLALMLAGNQCGAVRWPVRAFDVASCPSRRWHPPAALPRPLPITSSSSRCPGLAPEPPSSPSRAQKCHCCIV